MKLFFGFIFGIFGLFLAACTAGFFMPATLEVERSIIVNAHEEDVFPYLNNLETYRSWSALDAHLEDVSILTGGAESGLGQTQAWRNGPKGYEVGSREIVQESAPEFVQAKVTVNGVETTTTHALFSNSNGTVTILTKRELPQPGFPYIGRLRATITKNHIVNDLDAALAKLKIQIEANL